MSIEKHINLRDIWCAKKNTAPYVTQTPLLFSPVLSKAAHANIYLKLENLQTTGSFKVRGAANKILSLTAEQKEKGVTTFSTGNHGLAVSYMARKLGIKATICMSKHVPEAKLKAIQQYAPEIIQIGNNQDNAEKYCHELVETKGLTLIKPFDDPKIIAGQGVIGLEILEELPDIDAVVVPLSGGGLISGIALSLKLSVPDIEVTGVSMEKSAVMIESLKAGKPVVLEEERTLADSLLGGIGMDNRYTFDITKNYVDKTEKISEEEIAKSILFMLENHKQLIEGASAVTIAYALRNGNIKPGSHTVLIISGNGVNISWLKEML